MKKIIFGAFLLISVFAIASCGASRKTGCPAVASNSSLHSIKA
jgi:hypothetical protein